MASEVEVYKQKQHGTRTQTPACGASMTAKKNMKCAVKHQTSVTAALHCSSSAVVPKVGVR